MAVVPDHQTIGVFSRGIMKIPQLTALLGARRLIFDPSDADASKLDAVVGWGRKPNTVAPARFAKRHGLTMLRLEDGFLRSVGLGVAGSPPLSIVVDDLGIYYDAQRPSRLETLLATSDESDPLLDPDLIARARRLMLRLKTAGISKYNDSAPDADVGFPDDGRPRVLVVDQTAGDMSIELGGLAKEDYARVLDAALAEHPDAEVLVKAHPDVLAGKKCGCVNPRNHDRIRMISAHVQPYAILERVGHVYVGTSQLGMEALMAGCQVTCFGSPFYAGWGLTDDRGPTIDRRSRQRSLEEVVAAAYLLYPRYRSPSGASACEAENVVEHLALQREQFHRNAGHHVCIGFSRWKRGFMGDFLACPGGRIDFVRSAAEARSLADEESKLVVWGRKPTQGLEELAERSGARVIRVEDGFLRSVGLGSDLVAPASLVFDTRGIYFDPNHDSDLENILSSRSFSDSDIARARALRTAIVDARVSKYVVGDDEPLPRPPSPNQRVVLVPGQVEDDASIQLGCRDVRTNGGLIRAVRADRPSAHLIYKPHPDVVSGNRIGGISDEERAMCDLVIEDRTLDQCLDIADEVHTMTSLVGFESLLRGKDVHVYGLPFYAGWGLTNDRHILEHRTRKLSLDQLVAAALIHYPRYLDPTTREFTTPEAIIEYLASHRGDRDAVPLGAPWIVRQARKLMGAIKEIRRAR